MVGPVGFSGNPRKKALKKRHGHLILKGRQVSPLEKWTQFMSERSRYLSKETGRFVSKNIQE